ncbi:MAG: hypothetical protein QOI79_1416, partial [Mycobacterium sp.]|nr:hypothetical protein [Mycobacterium sp.]
RPSTCAHRATRSAMALPLDRPPPLTAPMSQTVWRRKPRASWPVDCSRSVPGYLDTMNSLPSPWVLTVDTQTYRLSNGLREAMLQNMPPGLATCVEHRSVFFEDPTARGQRTIGPIMSVAYGGPTSHEWGQLVRSFHPRPSSGRTQRSSNHPRPPPRVPSSIRPNPHPPSAEDCSRGAGRFDNTELESRPKRAVVVSGGGIAGHPCPRRMAGGVGRPRARLPRE